MESSNGCEEGDSSESSSDEDSGTPSVTTQSVSYQLHPLDRTAASVCATAGADAYRNRQTAFAAEANGNSGFFLKPVPSDFCATIYA